MTGAVQTFSEILTVALTIFTGAGALAILYSESGSREEAQKMVKQVAPYLVSGALIVALVAPVFEQIFYLSRLRYAAAIAVLVIALKISEVDIAEKFTVPSIIVTGMALSLKQPASIAITSGYVAPALLTVATALLVLYAATYLDPERLNLDIIRGAGTLVLILVSLSLLGLNIPSHLSLAVLSTAVAAASRPEVQNWALLTSK
ncbi:MAG: hypothetical protein ACI977_000764 [Candidatus Nanohaloarchaea archaeon]